MTDHVLELHLMLSDLEVDSDDLLRDAEALFIDHIDVSMEQARGKHQALLRRREEITHRRDIAQGRARVLGCHKEGKEYQAISYISDNLRTTGDSLAASRDDLFKRNKEEREMARTKLNAIWIFLFVVLFLVWWLA